MTEIYGTLGPACAQPDLLEKMFAEGMTGMRLNTSHSGLEESEPVISSMQQAAQRAGVKPEFLIDMQGPEIRIGDLPAPLTLKASDKIVLLPQSESAADTAAIPVPDPVFAALDAVLAAGDRVLLDDGRLELAVTFVKPDIMLRVLRGGLLQNRKSLKVVDKTVSGPAVTAQDIENIRLAEDYGVTVLMQPFVTKAGELLEVRRVLCKYHLEHVRIFAKIENCEGMEHIRDILPYADMVVIARGDLGNDMPLWKLPAAQKALSEICKKEKKPFLIVTQMLASMVHNPFPTRAEVSDIFHAVTDGAAAVMVTNETAAGRYPAEVIRYLKKTVQEAEAWMQNEGKSQR